MAILAFEEALAEMEQDERIEILEGLVKTTREELEQVSQKVKVLPVSVLEEVRDFYRRSEEEREALLSEIRQQVAVLRREHEELPAQVTEDLAPHLTYLNDLAKQGLEVKIITEKEIIIKLQERLKAGEVDEVIRKAEKRKAERVREYSSVLARGYLLKGDDEFHAGHFEEAEAFYRLSLEEARSSEEEEIIAFCFYELGAAVGTQGRHEEAKECFTEALRRKLDSPGTYYKGGWPTMK